MNVIEVHDLSRDFGRRRVVNAVSFAVPRGSILKSFPFHFGASRSQ